MACIHRVVARSALPFSRRAALSFHSRSRRVENCLTVTGSSPSVELFKAACEPVQRELSNAVTRPVHAQLWSRSSAAKEPLSFQRILPTATWAAWPWDHEQQRCWGSATDAQNVALLQGRPRLKGRSSVRYEFETGDSPPLQWLDAAARQYPSLRLGFKYAIPAAAEAYEMEFLQGRLVAKAQVSYASWMWRARVRRPEFFVELKELLRLPDGRLPKKRRLTAADVEARLLAGGELQRAVELLHTSVNGLAGKSRLKKLWRGEVLPEFVAWLHAAEPEPELVLA